MKRARPSCSVVVPVRNDARALERCLVALQGQLLLPDEVVIVDNDSSDDSAGVAERYGATVLVERQVGIAAAAARGYDAAAGEVILRLDADSVPPADWTQRVVTRFAEDEGLDALTGPGVFAAAPRAARPLTDWYWRIYFERVGRAVGATPLFGSNLGMRAEAWREVGPEVHRDDLMVHDDLDLTIHLVRSGRRLDFDPELRVAVSMRPLLHPFGMIRRARRAAHTLALHPDPPVTAGGAATRARSRTRGAPRPS